MKYRARLIDPGVAAERPVEIFSQSRDECEAWARRVLKKAVSEDAAVNVYQTSEQQIDLISKRSLSESQTEGEA